MSIERNKVGADLLEEAYEFILWHVEDSSKKALWLKKYREFDKGGEYVRHQENA